MTTLPRWLIIPVGMVVVVAVAVVVLLTREPLAIEPPVTQDDPPRKPMTVSRFVEPEDVVHPSRFRFSFDPPSALTELRETEHLDAVVVAAVDEMDAFRRLNAWTRGQFEPGVPDPYPPLDARIILRDIRSGFTGGFCAQYNYVLVQSLQSLGYRARYVTVVDHEVIEVWLEDEQRWVCLDPLHAATYLDEDGRALAVIDLSRRYREDKPIIPGPGSLPGTAETVAKAFGRFSVWLRNDHVTHPINFTDIERYKVEFLWDPLDESSPGGLSTVYPEDLY